jgi:hypothetical protein
LTDAQHEFIFLCKQEREKMKRESAEREMQKNQMKNNFG